MGRTDGFPKIGIFAVFLGGSEIACLNDYQVRQRKKRIPTFPFLDWCFWWCSIAHPERGSRRTQRFNLTTQRSPNQSLQATVGSCGFWPVFGFRVGFGGSNGFRQTPTAPELGSLGVRNPVMANTERTTIVLIRHAESYPSNDIKINPTPWICQNFAARISTLHRSDSGKRGAMWLPPQIQWAGGWDTHVNSPPKVSGSEF